MLEEVAYYNENKINKSISFFPEKYSTLFDIFDCRTVFPSSPFCTKIKVDTSYWGETAYGGVVLLLIDSKGGGTGGILYADKKNNEVITAAGYAHFDGKKYYIEDFSKGHKIAFEILEETSYSAILRFSDGDVVELFKGFADDFQEAAKLFNSFR